MANSEAPKAPKNGGPSFSRYFTTRNGPKIDAYDYGHKAWPIGGNKK